MIINKLSLKKYGKFENKEFNFAPGINIFYGKNETGKSTIATALKTFFYTELTGKQGFKKNYVPLSSDKGVYDVDFSTDDKSEFKSLVTLGKSNSKTLIKTISLSTGEELKCDSSKLGEHFFKLSEEMFDSVCYIKDLSSYDNLITYKNDVHDGLSKMGDKLIDIDLSEVLGKIKAELLEYKRPSSTGKIFPIEKRLEEIEKKLSDIEDIKESLEGIRDELALLKEEEKSLCDELSDLIKKEEHLKKFEEYQNAKFQLEIREKIKKDEELLEASKIDFTPLSEDELNILKGYEGSNKKEKNSLPSVISGIVALAIGICLLFIKPVFGLISLISIFPFLNFLKIKKGEIKVHSTPVKNINPKAAIKNGFALLTEERRATGIFGGLSIKFNSVISNLKNYSKAGILKNKKMNEDTAWVIKSMNVKTPDMKTHIKTLSGGNQQKVILGRWLLTDPEILMLDEPTRGIDVGAKYEIYQLILNLAKKGKAVMMVSSEMPELLGICDRILVMSNGRVAGILDNNEDISQEKIMTLASKYI